MAEWATLPSWLSEVGWLRLDLLARLVLAAVLGGAIGLEREASRKPAGFRTNLLICVGATLLTEISITISVAAGGRQLVADPGRIAAQIVSGIGFLGAGTIIQARGNVIGLTTAATLWVVAAIGMAVGARAYVEAVGTTVLVIIALMLLGRVESHLIRRRSECTVQVAVDPEPALVESVASILEEAGFRVTSLDVLKEEDGYTATFQMVGPRPAWPSAQSGLLELRGVRKISRL